MPREYAGDLKLHGDCKLTTTNRVVANIVQKLRVYYLFYRVHMNL